MARAKALRRRRNRVHKRNFHRPSFGCTGVCVCEHYALCTDIRVANRRTTPLPLLLRFENWKFHAPHSTQIVTISTNFERRNYFEWNEKYRKRKRNGKHNSVSIYGKSEKRIIYYHLSISRSGKHVWGGSTYIESDDGCRPYLAKNTIELDTHPSIPLAVPSPSTAVLSFLSFDAQPPILYDSNVYRMWE